MLEHILLYVVFPIVVAAVLGVFGAIYHAFYRLAETVIQHDKKIAVHEAILVNGSWPED